MKANILSIDGGGIRGIITAQILAFIEEKLENHNKNTHLSDYFDMIAGTSSGGIIAAMLTTPDHTGRPKFKAKDIVEFFTKEGGHIFDISLWKKLSSMGGLTDEKYSAVYLDKTLDHYFGSTMLSQSTTSLLITAYDIRNRAARFFATTDTRMEGRNFLIKDICRAAMATPSYFEPAKIKSANDTPYAFIDGGLFANNPGLTAYAEARTLDFAKFTGINEKPANPSANEMFFVSIGNGISHNPYFYEQAKDWGSLQWIKPIIDMVMSANIETVDFTLKQLFRTCINPEDYVRICPILSGVNPAIDDASEKNILAIIDLGEKFIDDNKEILNNVANKLIHFSKEY
jgi:uncharacterized protein